MASSYESFWQRDSYAVVGDAARKNFPVLTYRGLKKLGKVTFPVDPSSEEIDGDRVYPDLESLPEKVDAVVLETPVEDTKQWIARAADAGVNDVWIHMGRDSPEALALAKERGMKVQTGACAVMYLPHGVSYHSIHKWIAKVAGKY